MDEALRQSVLDQLATATPADPCISYPLEQEFPPMTAEDIARILSATIKNDFEGKVITFLAGLLAYTDHSQLNIGFSGPSSSGKSYVASEVISLFPPESTRIISYASPSSFFHETGVYCKEDNSVFIDLSRKILVFLDQPHLELLARLRPLLSHDRREIVSMIADKSGRGGLRTKKSILKGYPSVIFCTAFQRMDEQESSRLLLLSPSTSEEKIKTGIHEKIKRESDPGKYLSDLEADPWRQSLKDRIRAIRDEHITDIRIEHPENVGKLFLASRRRLRPRHQRDIGKLISLIQSFALLNFWHRERDGSVITANDSDVSEALSLWDRIARPAERGISPYLDTVFEEVIRPLGANHHGIKRTEILRKHQEVYGRPIASWQLRQELLPMLENCGLIVQEPDPDDRRSKLLYVVEDP